MRIRFADRTMLEGVLPSTSRLSDLYDFVSASLASPSTPFVLCTSLDAVSFSS